MEKILHRRNTIQELDETPSTYGVEIDIRTRGKDLILAHDPFTEGTLFEQWLEHYNHGTIILNVKEDGLENNILYLLSKFNVNKFFFLDQPFPSIIKSILNNESRLAIRVSEYESIETALSLKNQADWIWIDSFKTLETTSEDSNKLKQAGFNLCLVSPELQNRKQDIDIVKQLIRERNIILDAVCTKFPEKWF